MYLILIFTYSIPTPTSGHSSDEHLVQFTETAVNIVKKIFVNSTSALEQIGSFYLIYAFYFKQPTRQFCKLRLTMDEASVLLQFYDNLPADYDQVRLCYWKLVQADAFRFEKKNNEIIKQNICNIQIY